MSDIAELVKSIREVVNAFAGASGTFDWCTQKHARNAVGRHRCIAGLLGVPDEHDVRNGYIREILENDVVADGEFQDDLEKVDAAMRSAMEAAVSARKNFDALCERWSDEYAKLTDQKCTAEARISELTERLKEHALHNAEVRETVWNMTGGKCFYCEVDLIRCVGGEQDRSRCFHIDHIVPKVSGGPDHISNYVPACERCNISKNAKSFVEFLAWRKAQQAQPQLTVIEGGAVA